jgi:hypothetical protein
MFSFPKKNKNQIQQQINQQDKLTKLIKANVLVKSRQFTNQEFTKSIILDEVNKKIHLFTISNNNCKSYNFDDLIQSEIIIDNLSVTKTNRGKQVIGSVIGGAIAGIGGMVIGGLSSEQITTEKIKNIELKLTLNDINNPIFKINFTPPLVKAISKDLPQIKNAINSIERWHGIFDVLIKQQNKVTS